MSILNVNIKLILCLDFVYEFMMAGVPVSLRWAGRGVSTVSTLCRHLANSEHQSRQQHPDILPDNSRKKLSPEVITTRLAGTSQTRCPGIPRCPRHLELPDSPVVILAHLRKQMKVMEAVVLLDPLVQGAAEYQSLW